MNKYTLLFLLIFLMTIVVYFIDLSTAISTSMEVGDIVDAPDEASIVNLWTMTQTYLKLMTFQIAGIPAFINFLFWPATLVILYMLITDILLPVADLIIPDWL